MKFKIYKSRIYLLIILLMMMHGLLHAQEICDNAIDDDNDGLIDINDDDCECASLINSSLIPNPSFEEMTCCPNANARLDCAVGWIQASPPTTDYVHTCGNYLGNTNIPAFAPLPFPDGNGAVGFRNGEAFSGGNYKEYVGACLTESMKIGVSYRIDFFIGFRNNIPGNGEIDVAIFGSTDCSNLPFGNNNSIGCPVNTGNYTQLDEINVTGNNEWVKVTFEFTPTEEYEVIVLGPTCPLSVNPQDNPYFYIDGLNLAESSEFGEPFSSTTGNICSDNLRLTFEAEAGHSYQWYKEGIALFGETNPEILLEASNDEPGNYVLLITTPDFCFLSEEYFLRIPPYYERDTVNLCANMTHVIGQESFDVSGDYEALIDASDGCDSIVLLSLNVFESSSSDLVDSFCQDTEYEYYDLLITEAGTYNTIISNAAGCDSFVTISLTQILTENYIAIQDTYDLDLGNSLDLTPDTIANSVVALSWLNQSGEIIGTGEELNNYTTFENTTLQLEAYDAQGCSVFVPIYIRVDRSNLRIFVPNVFSPNDDGINDYWKFFSTPVVDRIDNLRIFDRWGNLVFKDDNITESNNYVGWNGFFNGTKAAVGVYTYTFNVTYLDNTQEIISGDLTLMR